MNGPLSRILRGVCLASAAALVLAGSVRTPAADAARVAITQSPRELQLYPRDATDSATVTVAGSVVTAPYDSVRIELWKGISFYGSRSAPLVYGPSGAPFSLTARIHAELAEYQVRLFVDSVLITWWNSITCGDAFLIDGQSNAAAQDFDGLATATSEWVRTYGTSSVNPSLCAADTAWHWAQGHAYYASGGIGVWGEDLGMRLSGVSGVPIAILNGAVGSTTIDEHFRNDANPTDLTTIYGRLLYRMRGAGLARSVRAILWDQGESDTGPDWNLYPSRFDTLWGAWQADYSPREHMYAFQVRPGCGLGHQPELRDVERQLPRFHPELALMSTAGLVGHDGCHYHYDGYVMMSEWISRLLARDFYGSTDTVYITPPAVQSAYYIPGTSHLKIRVTFDSDVVWPADTLGQSLHTYFELNDTWGLVQSGQVDPLDSKSIILNLNTASYATRLTYIPNRLYLAPYDSVVYEGPWLRNPRGVGALTFCNFTIDSTTSGVPVGAEGGGAARVASAPNPFDTITTIEFALAEGQRVRVSIFDSEGRLVRTLADRVFPAGRQAASWDGRGRDGTRLAPGPYFYRVIDRDGAHAGKVMLLR